MLEGLEGLFGAGLQALWPREDFLNEGYPVRALKAVWSGQVGLWVRKYSPQGVGSFRRSFQNCLNLMDTLAWMSHSSSSLVWSRVTTTYEARGLLKWKPPNHSVILFYPFHQNSASDREKRNNLSSVRMGRAALLTCLNWLVPLKFVWFQQWRGVCNNVNTCAEESLGWVNN